MCTAILLLTGASPLHALEPSGWLRSQLFATRDSRQQPITSAAGRLRLALDGGDRLRLHLAYDHELLQGGLPADPVAAAALQRPQPTWLDADAPISRRSHLYWHHTLYRGWLAWERGAWRIKLGRQRIAWGSGRIWNPTDRFNPVAPTALEPDWKLGVDALRLEWNGVRDNRALTAVIAPGRAAHGVARKLALRWQQTRGDLDLALTGGAIGRTPIAGIDLTGNLGDGAIRLEWLGEFDHAAGGELILGGDNNWRLPWLAQPLYLAVEYLYHGTPGRPASPDRLTIGSRHQIGASLGYDLTPLWRIDLLAIVDPDHGGSFMAPRLRWSAGDDLELDAIVQLPQGGAFTPLEPLWALRADYFF
ncbi:MAG: hypothetical protein D6682_04390 [Zetaproteobacteria bacterium]|nr:MAG: hypothetical protein D6682_04390 [Zetaproteobacteria bacterium]